MSKFLHNIPFTHRFEFRNALGQLIVVPSFTFVLKKASETTAQTPVDISSVDNSFYDYEFTLSADTDKEITYYTGTYYSPLTPPKSFVFEVQALNDIPVTESSIRDILGVSYNELPDSVIEITHQFSMLSEEFKEQIRAGEPTYLRIMKLRIAIQSMPTLYNSLIKEESNGTNTRIRNSQSLKDLEVSLRGELSDLEHLISKKCSSKPFGFGAVSLCGFTGPKGFTDL